MLRHGSYQDNKVFLLDDYFYFVGGSNIHNRATSLITRAKISEVDNYTQSYKDEPIEDEIIGCIDENIFLYGLCQIDNYAIVIGGANDNKSLSNVYVIEILNNEARVVYRNNLPIGSSFLKSVVEPIDKNSYYIYVFNGYNYHYCQEVFKARFYNGKLTDWALYTQTPIALSGAYVFYKNEEIYLFGGKTLNNTQNYNVYKLSIQHFPYWIQLPGLSISTSDSSFVHCGNSMYLIGGYQDNNLSKDIYRVNVKDSLISIEPFSKLTTEMIPGSCICVGNYQYVFGYYNKSFKYFNDILKLSLPR